MWTMDTGTGSPGASNTPLHYRVLNDIPWVDARFFTAEGGTSVGDYASPSGNPGLNCALGGKDPARLGNREIAAAAFGVTAESLLTTREEDDAVLVVEKAWGMKGRRPFENAMVANQFYDHVLGVLTCNCAPVILADKTQPITGIIHAGREQLMGGLLEQTVAVMEQQGSKRENIAAAIGPCAGVEGPNYVINTNNDCFLSQAKVQDPLITRHFQNTGQDVTGRPLVALNIQSYARQRLEKCGVGDIRCVEIDTITSPICYSRNKKGPPSRLMLSGIKLLRYGS